ncbi:hypothetical protein Acr_27g0000990 [Actinidia rufa]|uniref:Uncharacterized protein n=1 Tax=Actinidia rufa TaxID=165716 RepID=A0A7J0H5J2_9ERIC|nr:hypothetical protein Acr_27g0000990 [Actinidia rufa]
MPSEELFAPWHCGEYTDTPFSLSEFRNLFNLNSNPKLDQGWMYFKARYKKTLLRGYPSNVKGWKSKFFFVLVDEWELLVGSSREGVPRVPRTWGVPVFVFPGSMALGTVGEECPEGGHRAHRATRVSHALPMNTFNKTALLRSHYDGTKEDFTLCPRLNPTEVVEGKTMSKRISLKKLGKKVEKSKNKGSTGSPIPAKGVVISEKRPRDDHPISPSKKGKVMDSPKGKEVAPIPEPKKKTIRSGDAGPKATSSKPREGSSPSLGTILELMTSILSSPSVAKKILRGALVLGSSLAVRSREAGENASLQEGQATSMESEVDTDSLKNKLDRWGMLVVELREAMYKARSSAVEEFKSSSDFLGAVENAASKYFGKGFDFCKRQLHCHHPDLAINLEKMGLDLDLLAEEDEAANGGSDGEKDKGDYNPPLS